MKVTDKRRQINRLINEGVIKEIGSVSSRAKVVRNLTSKQCDDIIVSKEINYGRSQYSNILDKEGVVYTMPTGGDSGGSGDGANGDGANGEGDDDAKPNNTDDEGSTLTSELASSILNEKDHENEELAVLILSLIKVCFPRQTQHIRLAWTKSKR